MPTSDRMTAIEITAELFEHQRDTIKFLNNDPERLSAIVASDPGTGKTLIAFYQHLQLANFDPDHKTLFVAPHSTLTQIQQKLHEHTDAPRGHSFIYSGPRRFDQSAFDNAPLIITSYSVLQTEFRLDHKRETSLIFNHPAFDFIILDEAHTIKNPKTTTHKAALHIPHHDFTQRLALSGTPIQNSTKDIAAISAWLRIEPYNTHSWWKSASPEMLQEWRNNFFYHIDIDDVHIKLPEKYTYYHHIKLSPQMHTFYEALRNHASDIVYSFLTRDVHISFGEVLALITRLKQASFSPLTLQDILPKGDIDTALASKVEAVYELLDDTPPGDKTIIFSQYARSVKLTQRILEEAGTPSLTYTGDLSTDERTKVLHEFTHSDTNVLIANINCCGTGLNITAANHVIFLDLWWNKALHQQAEARAHRIGQTKNVHIHYLITPNTIEEWIFALQQHKDDIAHHTLFNKAKTGPSIDDIHLLYSQHLSKPTPPPTSPIPEEEADPDIHTECSICLQFFHPPSISNFGCPCKAPLCLTCLQACKKIKPTCPVCRTN